MRNFILLIRRYWNLILFLILEIICVVMIAKSRNLQGMDIVSSSNSLVGYFYKKQNEVVYYFQLRQLNKSLLEENAQLNSELAQIHYVDTFQTTIAKLPEFVKSDSVAPVAVQLPADSLLKKTGPPKIVKYSSYSYIPARVIKNSVSDVHINFITLNRGSESGIEKGMAVVTGNGIVGRVAHVSPNYATVASVLSDRKVSARLSDGSFDFVYWEPGDPAFLYMNNLPIMQPVKKGDSIFSTSYSYFPENILIGTVAKVDTLKANNSKKLKIRLSTNFRNLQYVYVVEDRMSAERLKLEETTSKEVKK